MIVRVQTGARLHFGLLSLPEPGVEAGAANPGPKHVRAFGGVGLMIEHPRIVLTARPAKQWSANGPLADRVLAVARQVACHSERSPIRPHHFQIEEAFDEHIGLGLGTQLALAVTQALAVTTGLEIDSTSALARLAGRGERSAIGVHGFIQGGFLVEAGKQIGQDLSPLIFRGNFPESWQVLLAIPTQVKGLHGRGERDVFSQLLREGCQSPTNNLCRLVLKEMLPALIEEDLQSLGEGLFEYNRQAGLPFLSAQGDFYASAEGRQIVEWLRNKGVRGVGQTSWGPTIYALLESQDQAMELLHGLRAQFPGPAEKFCITRAASAGAKIEIGNDDAPLVIDS